MGENFAMDVLTATKLEGTIALGTLDDPESRILESPNPRQLDPEGTIGKYTDNDCNCLVLGKKSWRFVPFV
jgi:hypothetical protein